MSKQQTAINATILATTTKTDFNLLVLTNDINLNG